jgi:subtilase family serine protease
MTIQLWLKSDVAGETAYANEVSDPHNPSFHHYLSPDAYTAKFGPDTTTANAVQSWLRQQGFTTINVDSQRNYARATAPVSTIQNALQVQMKTYRLAGSATPVTSNDRDVTLPTSIAGDVLGVSGLNNVQPTTARTPSPTSARIAAAAGNCSNYYGQHTQTGLPALDGTTSFPTQVCGLYRYPAARRIRHEHGEHRQGRDGRLHRGRQAVQDVPDTDQVGRGERPARAALGELPGTGHRQR